MSATFLSVRARKVAIAVAGSSSSARSEPLIVSRCLLLGLDAALSLSSDRNLLCLPFPPHLTFHYG